MAHYFTSNENLRSKLRTISYNYKGHDFIFYSDLGVFSKNKIDYGSKVLVEKLLETINSSNLKILDVGCGFGFMGITVAKILNASLDMLDVNNRAVDLAKQNILENKLKNARAFYSNIYENINCKYDLIITNPPIRAGKETVYQILDAAKDYLEENGELWFVVRKDQGAKSTIMHLENVYNVEIMERNKGFFVIKAKIR